MTAIDKYLAQVAEPQRQALQRIRDIVKQTVPDAEEGKSYGMPAFLYKDRPLAGFIAAQSHLSFFPFSPEVIEQLSDDLAAFDTSKGTIRFTVDNPLPDGLLKRLVLARLAQLTSK